MEPPEDRNRVGDEFVPLIPGPIIPAFRLAVGLGDPERERALLPALSEGGALVVVERCLSADQLVGVLPTGQIDLALVADDLHRLSDDALAALVHTRVPLVVLAGRPDDPRWQTGHATVLPLDAPPDVVRTALLAAWRGRGRERVGGRGGLSARVALRQGLVSNLGNPKMAVFFLSLLPQFGGSFGALLALGLVFSCLTLVWLTAYGAAVARAGDFLRRSRVRRALDTAVGIVLVALGLRIAGEAR
jgi:hypothetical protein